MPSSDETPMTPAEMLTVTEAMGWSRTDTCRVLGVKDRTVRWWMAEPGRIPQGVRLEIEDAEDATGRAVEDLVNDLRGQQSPTVEVWRTDAEMWNARPETHPWPSRWWRVVAFRAALEVEGTVITWAGDPVAQQGAPQGDADA